MANLLIKQLKQNGAVFLPVTAAEAVATKWTFMGDASAKTESLAAVLADLQARINAGSVTMALEGTPVEGSLNTSAAALPVVNNDGDKDAAIVLRNANNEIVSYVDAADFLIDGVLDSVEIVKDASSNDTNVLKFTWNTDAGKTAIEIDLERIFGDELQAVIDQHVADVSTLNATITALETKHDEDKAAIDASIARLDASVNALEDWQNALDAEDIDLSTNYVAATGTTSVGENVSTGVEAGDSVQAAISKLDSAIVTLTVNVEDGIKTGTSKASDWAEGSTDFIVATA